MVNIRFDKKLELIFGLQYCVFKDNKEGYNIFLDTNKDYCNDFLKLYKENASDELIDYIKKGGLDTFDRTILITDSLDENYNLKDNEFIEKISKNNFNFDKIKLEKLLKDFVNKSNYDMFFNNHRNYYDKVIKLFKEKLNKYVEFDDNIFIDFYGYKLKDFQIILYDFTNGSFGMNYDNKITFISNLFPSDNENEIVKVQDKVIVTLFHEFSHPYCNPLGVKYFSNVDISNIVEKAKENGLENCYNGLTVINEYVVRAAEVYLGRKYLPKEVYNAERSVEWHKSRGYIRIDELVKLFDKKDNYDNFEDFYKNEIFHFFEKRCKNESFRK